MGYVNIDHDNLVELITGQKNEGIDESISNKRNELFNVEIK
jgi:hypothetical protein